LRSKNEEELKNADIQKKLSKEILEELNEEFTEEFENNQFMGIYFNEFVIQ
jgi:flagellar basal body-associated protein FliL